MKKIFLLAFVLCLSGCVNEDFTKVCTVKTKGVNFTDSKVMEVSFNNKDEVTDVVVTRSYKGDVGVIENIKDSASSYNNALAGEDGVKVSVSKDDEEEYEVKYYLDVFEVSDEVLSRFDLKRNSVKFFNKMRNSNIDCK